MKRIHADLTLAEVLAFMYIIMIMEWRSMQWSLASSILRFYRCVINLMKLDSEESSPPFVLLWHLELQILPSLPDVKGFFAVGTPAALSLSVQVISWFTLVITIFHFLKVISRSARFHVRCTSIRHYSLLLVCSSISLALLTGAGHDVICLWWSPKICIGGSHLYAPGQRPDGYGHINPYPIPSCQLRGAPQENLESIERRIMVLSLWLFGAMWHYLLSR